ncbi:MAG: DUF4423 domain-containing protein [Nitrososphaera sp.]|nr:DUF4423 domain-containing protein [Nitrososphaera sp.]
MKNHEGYPKLRDLARMVPALTPEQLNAAVRYLERTGTIVIDGDGYIVWSRNETRDSLTLGDVAVFSDEFNKFVNDR